MVFSSPDFFSKRQNMLKTSAIIVCYNRKHELKKCISSILKQTKKPDEIIIIDNNSSDGTETLFKNGKLSDLSIIKYFRLDKNMGVTGGRNYGIKKADGDILVFFDDDALLGSENTFENITYKFKKDPQAGILAFKIMDHDTKTIRREEFPHTDKSLDPDKEFETTYFIGAGHAIKKRVFDKCGLYPADYVYGMEELDLSFRAIDKGYRIIYFPEISVWHKKSTKGRSPDEMKWINTYRNRLAVSYKYLKHRHLIVLSFIWFLKIFKESGSIITPVKGLLSFFSYRKELMRQPVSNTTIKTIKNLKGRIWY